MTQEPDEMQNVKIRHDSDTALMLRKSFTFWG